jgi:peptide-methionine (R)-S-oxide reductase
MPTRRQFLTVAGVALGLGPVAAWMGRSSTVETGKRAPEMFAVTKTDEQWRDALTDDQYYVLRRGGTEWAFSSPLNKEKRHGTFACAACGHPLFSSETKYESGTGWPSFWQPLDGGITTRLDRSWLMVRTEVHCANCGGHLGHVFPDGPRPTGLRYCMNGVALTFTPDARKV